MSRTQTISQVVHPYISRKKDTCGGKPIITGTRIKVSQISIEYDRMGMSPDEIIEAHPHLTLPQIHDALSYYYENAEAINEDIRGDEKSVAQLRRSTPSVMDQKSGST
jgi:uncharacterized protein (DUF433 family)